MARLNPSPIRMYRGTTAQHSAYAGPIGELTVDTDKNTVVVQNGTQGGVPLAKDAEVVHKKGVETINGNKTFNSVTYFHGVNLVNGSPIEAIANFNKGELFHLTFTSGIDVQSEDYKDLGYLRVGVSGSTGESYASIAAFKFASDEDTSAQIAVIYPASGDPYATAPNTRSTPADNEIVTVDYLEQYVADHAVEGPQGPQGDPGPAGADGAAATIAVGSVTTGEAGTQASVTNAGTSSAAVLNFTIPRGDKGDKGDTGDAGPQGERGPQGEQGPAGADGARGPQGPAGADGAAATIAVGTVTTGAAGSKAAVTNEGTSSAAVLNFTIPQGAKGDKGDKGEKGDTGPQGERGPAGADGADGARGPQGPVGPAGEYTAGTGITISGDTLSVNTTWLTTQIDNRIAADHLAYLPLYFTADSLELHSFVPAGVTTVKYSAIEADGSGTSGLTLKMGRDIGSTASMNVTGTAANCSSYAGHSVTFTLSGLGNQTEIAVMIEFA